MTSGLQLYVHINVHSAKIDDDLSLIRRTHMVEEENCLMEVIL